MNHHDLQAMLRAAHRAMDVAVNHVLSHPVTQVHEKGDRDIVTDVDVTVEDLVRSCLHDYTPNLGFLGEGTGAVGDRALYWVLDPIDGTTNFSHGVPLNAVALGLVDGEHPILGVIALPFLGKRYWATRGGGAYRDELPISVSSTTHMSDALIALSDYGHGSSDSIRDLISSALDHQLTDAAQGVRRLGSAAVDLAWVADGSLDASVTLGNRTWRPELSSHARLARSSWTRMAARITRDRVAPLRSHLDFKGPSFRCSKSHETLRTGRLRRDRPTNPSRQHVDQL